MRPIDNPNPPSEFAHPIEAEFARLLDFYDIPWQYEPKTFPLAEDSEGNITEAFTPDFYLPSQELYVELTTRKQALITEKNGKIRAMKEHYPEVKVKLLNRRDMETMLIKYGMVEETPNLIGNPNGNNKDS